MFFHILTDLFREGAFSGLDSLEWLKLEDNAISALPGGDLFPASLKVILQQNHSTTLKHCNICITLNNRQPKNAFEIHNHLQSKEQLEVNSWICTFATNMLEYVKIWQPKIYACTKLSE